MTIPVTTPTPLPGPLDDLKACLEILDGKTAAYARLNAYAAGTQPLTYLSAEARTALTNRLSTVSVGIPGLLVSSLVERLRVTGFTRPDVWGDWRRNDMDQLAPVAHREALTLGDAFVLVWARPDGTPLITVESATQVAAQVDPATREIVRAVKRWEVPKTGSFAILYEPDVIRRYFSPALGAQTTGYRLVESIDNPLGRPPVARLRNGGRLLDDGVSEMADVIPLTDALVKLLTDMLVSSEYTARPRRWATGVELDEDAATGEAVNPFPEANRMMIAEEADAKFGQLAGSDLGGYEAAINVVMRSISAVSGLPEHLLGVGGDNPTSADSIRASEAALTARAEAVQARFGKAWEDVARLAVAVREGVDPASVDVAVKWADPATRSVAQEADAVTKLYAAGLLPASVALRRLGYSDAEIDEIRAARRAEALDGAGVDLKGLTA